MLVLAYQTADLLIELLEELSTPSSSSMQLTLNLSYSKPVPNLVEKLDDVVSCRLQSSIPENPASGTFQAGTEMIVP